jgi:S-adenosylmethionine hydrolase
MFGPLIKRDPHGSCIRIKPEYIIEQSERVGYRPGSSRTFHARDIFAPAAALLSLGLRPETIGNLCPKPAFFSFPEPERKGRSLEGQIIYFDHFGNAVTNIPSGLLSQVPCGSDTAPVLSLGGRDINIPFLATYSMAQKGQPLFLVNSFNLVEIAVSCGSARKALGLNLDDKIFIGCEAN